ncbi:MAG: hypothetical protein JNK21_11255 [Rhodospirillaceae bacterium]|nr:hypothetical protein [Rhodospirillaceae bacterium]
MTPILTSRFRDNKFRWHELFNLSWEAEASLDILKGDASDTGLGGIEMQGYDAALIDTDKADPQLFDGGTCMLTYATHDSDAAYAAISASPLAKMMSVPQVPAAKPYKKGRSFTFLGPDQEYFEICESMWA